MEVVRLEIERGQLCVGDLDAGRVLASIEFGANLQAGPCRRVGDQIDNDFVTDQRPPTPVLGNVREHPMLDLVPFAGPGREVAHVHWQPQADRQGLQSDLPQTTPAAVASSTIGRDQQRVGVGVVLDP